LHHFIFKDKLLN